MQLVVVHKLMGVLPGLVSFGVDLLPGLLQHHSINVSPSWGAESCIVGHPPHVDGLISCGLGDSLVYCLEAKDF